MFHRLKPPAADFAAEMLATVLKLGGKNAYRDTVNALWERQPVYSDLDIRLSLPPFVDPDLQERPLVERIFQAFCRAKQDQSQYPSFLLPAGGWKKVLDTGFAYLQDAYEHQDVDRFHYFLANFGAWSEQTGIEESWAFRKVAASGRKQTHYEQRVMGQLIHWWKTFESDGRDLAALTIPRIGNQGGTLVDGHLIAPNCIYSDFYARLLANFVSGPRPLIAELGGGYGRLFYFLTRQLPDLAYIGVDLPEILCCASYYLMLAFPDKRFLLYGEADVTTDSLAAYDVVLQPSFQISQLPDRSCDLFINENSLGVIPPDASRYYVQEMCRAAEAIWHRNHEVRRNPFEDGSTSLINCEYPIDREQFDQVVRFCDVERLLGHTLAISKNDMYWYYFRRK